MAHLKVGEDDANLFVSLALNLLEICRSKHAEVVRCPFSFRDVMKHLFRSTANNISRLRYDQCKVQPVINAHAEDGSFHCQQVGIANGKLERLSMNEWHCSEAVIESDEIAWPVPPPLSWKDTRHRVVRSDFQTASSIEVEDFQLAIDAGGEEKNFGSGQSFEIQWSDSVQVRLHNMRRECDFIFVLTQIPDGNVAIDETTS